MTGECMLLYLGQSKSDSLSSCVDIVNVMLQRSLATMEGE